jgi:hypothetical protein
MFKIFQAILMGGVGVFFLALGLVLVASLSNWMIVSSGIGCIMLFMILYYKSTDILESY